MCEVSKKQRQGLMALSMVILVFALLAWYYVTQHGRMAVHHMGPISFHPENHHLYITNASKQVVLKARLGDSLPQPIYPLDCSPHFQQTDSICIKYVDQDTGSRVDKEYARMEIRLKPAEENLQCIVIEWTSLLMDYSPQDCLSLSDAHWYGGASLYRQLWPVDEISIPMQPYAMQDVLFRPGRQDVWGSVLENYWLSSRGVAVHIDEDVPLHVSFNEDSSHEICFKSEYLNSPYQNPHLEYPHMRYTVCVGDDIQVAHQSAHGKWFSKPSGIPDERMIRSPVWSTWARFKDAVNETQVVRYADDILQFNLSHSQIEIDDIYTTSYGAFDFNSTKFPDAPGMIRKLKAEGFRVTSWIHPFVNLESPNFREGIDGGYFLKDVSNTVPALVKWWRGDAGILDMTDNTSRQWYISNLESMRRDYGLNSFKFDAGETTFIPITFNATSQQFWNPNSYCTEYATLVARMGSMIEVRCAHQTQALPVFVRMFDKDSVWHHDNGLQTMIPSALAQGLLGYPFILPDMIGGNAYSGDAGITNVEILPDRELFIRWMELTAYLPAMQFSIAPWQYDDDDDDDPEGISTVTVAREMIRIHQEEVTPLLLKYAQEAVVTGNPIIRPLWWIAPHDETALTIDSEFLIGNELLVAPVVEQGARSRDIYLPQGQWKDSLRGGSVVEGGQWLREYPVQLDQIATFPRVEEGSSSKL